MICFFNAIILYSYEAKKNHTSIHESLGTNKQREKKWNYIAFPFFWIRYNNQCIREKHIWKYNFLFKSCIELLLNNIFHGSLSLLLNNIFHGSTLKLRI